MDAMTLMLILHVVIIILVIIVLALGTFTHANSTVLSTLLVELLSLLKQTGGNVPPSAGQSNDGENTPKS